MARLLSAPRPPAPSPTGPRPRLRTRRQKRAEVSRGATNPSSKSTQERGRARGRHPSSLRLGQGHHATRRDNWLHRPRQRHGWLPRYRTNAGGKSSNLALGLCQKATSGSSIGLEKPSCTHSQALEIAVEGPVSRLFAHESCNYLLLGSPKKGEPLLHRHGRAYPARHGTAPVQIIVLPIICNRALQAAATCHGRITSSISINGSRRHTALPGKSLGGFTRHLLTACLASHSAHSNLGAR